MSSPVIRKPPIEASSGRNYLVLDNQDGCVLSLETWDELNGPRRLSITFEDCEGNAWEIFVSAEDTQEVFEALREFSYGELFNHFRETESLTLQAV